MSSGIQTKCTCGAKNRYTCNKCSRIKMSMLLKNGHNHLKIKGRSGGLFNPVWYSHVSKNRYSDNSIISGMIKAFNKSTYKNATRILKFYDVKTGSEIRSVLV